MTKTHPWEEVTAARNLPPEKRVELDKQIQDEITEMEAELTKPLELTLAQLRKELGLTQRQMALKLGVSQTDISKFERRGNNRVSKLRKYIEALGGKLELVVKLGGKTILLRGSKDGQ